MANRHAIEWHDAEELLENRTSLVPALEEQHLQAREATAEAARSVANAEQEWAGATKVWQAADARHAASLAMRERLALDLSELGPDRERGEDTSADVKRRLLSLDKELLEAVESGARDRERLERSEHRLAEAGAAVKNEILASEPSQKSWNELRDACEEADLLSGLLTDGENANRTSRTAEQLVAQAAGQRDLLVDRLTQARGGEDLLALVQAIPSGIEIGGES
jgi:chromosome partition protein MukB